MLISEFAVASGMTVDTVRFYIAKGLIKPALGQKGGSRPYQVFNQADITAMQMIKLQKSLGYSLREIAELNDQYYDGQRTVADTAQALTRQIVKLEEKRGNLTSALNFLYAKLAWVEAGKPAVAPHADDYFC
ncbi:MerR family transcriptional regulator [Pantoea endophytica]